MFIKLLYCRCMELYLRSVVVSRCFVFELHPGKETIFLSAGCMDAEGSPEIT